MLTRPNIFNYAKKELSQDAVICWLLECCHSDDDKYRQIGIDFYLIMKILKKRI